MGGSKKMQQVRSIANRPQGGGNKKQGLPPSIGRPGWLSNFIRSSAGGYFRGIPAAGPVDPCPTNEKTDNQTVSTQAQAELLRGVTKITGNLKIDGDITDWTPFNCLKHIAGGVEIKNNTSQTISGFGSLTTIGGYFDIHGNAALKTISAFGNLTSVGGYFGIYLNTELTNASSLRKVVSVGAETEELGDLYFFVNTQFTNAAFATLVTSLKTIKGDIHVYSNADDDFAKPGALQKWGAAGSKAANTRTLNLKNTTVDQLATNSFGGLGSPPQTQLLFDLPDNS
jgi:hypothetical protein